MIRATFTYAHTVHSITQLLTLSGKQNTVHYSCNCSRSTFGRKEHYTTFVQCSSSSSIVCVCVHMCRRGELFWPSHCLTPDRVPYRLIVVFSSEMNISLEKGMEIIIIGIGQLTTMAGKSSTHSSCMGMESENLASPITSVTLSLRSGLFLKAVKEGDQNSSSQQTRATWIHVSVHKAWLVEKGLTHILCNTQANEGQR